jgi:hypothetical protein
MSGCHEPVKPKPALLDDETGFNWLVQSQKSGSIEPFG